MTARTMDTLLNVDRNSAICGCLSTAAQSNNPFAGDRDLTEAEKKELLREQAHEAVVRTNQKLMSLRNGVLFQSLVVSGDQKSARAVSELYTQNYLKNELQSSIQEHVRKQPLSAGIEIPENLSADFVSDNVDSNHCFSKRQYLAFKQIPSEGFFTAMTKTPSYREEDWDFKKLIAKVSDNGENYHEIESRLLFLQKNPLIKALFSVDSPAGSYIAEKKKQVFTAMKKAYSDTSCTMQLCKDQFITSGKYEELRKSLANVFSEPPVSVFVSKASLEEAKSIIGPEFPIALSSTFVPSVEKKIQEMNNCSINEVYAHESILTECAKTFAGACPTIQTVKSSFDKKNDQRTRWIFHRLQKEDFASKEMTGGYEEESKKICSLKRSNGTSPEINFFDYLKVRCKPGQASAECSEENRAALLGKFLSEYKALTGPAQEEDTADLADFLTTAKFQSLSQKAIEEVSKIGQTMQSYLTDVRQSIVNYEKLNPDARIREIAQNTQLFEAKPSTRSAVRNTEAPISPDLTDAKFAITPSINPERTFAQAAVMAPMVPKRLITPANKSDETVPPTKSIQARSRSMDLSSLKNQIEDLKSRVDSTPESEKKIARLENELRQAQAASTIKDIPSQGSIGPSFIQAPTAPSQTITSTSIGSGDAIFPVYFPSKAEHELPSSNKAQDANKRDLSGAALFNIRYNSADSKTNEAGTLIVAGASAAMDLTNLESRILESSIRDAGVVDRETYTKLQDSIRNGDITALSEYLSKIQSADGNLVRLQFSSPGKVPLSVVVMKDQSGRAFIPSFSRESFKRSPASLRNLNLLLGN